MTTTVHNLVFRPYGDAAGPVFKLNTWYNGVTLHANGPAGVTLGYRLTMDGAVIAEANKEPDLYRPSTRHPLEGPHAAADLLANLCSVFQVIGAIEALSGKDAKTRQKIETLETFLKHADRLWTCVVETLGEDATKG
jgi:hypothetical protein